MANAFNKEEKVAFEQLLEGFEDAQAVVAGGTKEVVEEVGEVGVHS